MSNGRIQKITVDELKAELERFNSAINSFRPYTKGFIKNLSSRFKGFNSDFIDEMENLLENMKDSKAPKLLKKAEKLYSSTKTSVELFEKVEKGIRERINLSE
ncbi:MAG: hypothetical protein GX660_15575 [Clostridiaceae bacterium]|nr:hypothetical protein [Clostridiaceae bacterium]